MCSQGGYAFESVGSLHGRMFKYLTKSPWGNSPMKEFLA